MPRESIAMSPAEVRAFLAQERWCVLGTLDPAGHPCADAVPCRLEGDALVFEVARGSRSLEHIRRDPRVCCATDRYPSYYEISGVTAHGRAEPAGDGEGGAWRFRLALDDVVSFDFGKIRRRPADRESA